MDEYKEIPYKVLHYMGGEINYGGRVTDDIQTLIRDYLTPKLFEDSYTFSPCGKYYAPALENSKIILII